MPICHFQASSYAHAYKVAGRHAARVKKQKGDVAFNSLRERLSNLEEGVVTEIAAQEGFRDEWLDFAALKKQLKAKGKEARRRNKEEMAAKER